jgi:hypothetical protein
MFISRTTREERVTIETALDSAFLKIDQAAQLEYHLHAGHGDAPCVQQYLESAARAKANVEDEEVHNCELKAQHHDQQAG